MNHPLQISSRCNTFLIITLGVMTLLFLAWPCYRVFVHYGIDVNEPWNAHFADAAMGRTPLYPGQDELITNNYPPMSFYGMRPTKPVTS